jgi:hypothetical protein
LRALAQAVSVALVLMLIPNPLAADPPEKQPTTVPTVAEERERLKTLKEAEFRRLKAVISSDVEYEKKLSALRDIAALATPEAVDLLSTLYDNPLKEDSESEQALLVELLGTTGCSAAGPTLLKAVQHPGEDGKVRLAAACAIVRIMGKNALSHLKKLAEDKVETVQNRAWTELLKQQDLNAMRHVFKTLEGKEKLSALAMIKEAHFTEAAKEVAEIAKETDFSKGPNEKILKLKALETALDLVHKESIIIAIELLDAITREQAEVLEVCSPKWLLGIYTQTGMSNWDKKKWQDWWEGEGKTTPLFSSYLDATALSGIGEAVMKWIKSKESGPLVKEEVIYLLDSPFARAAAKSDGSVRVYTEKEMELLKVKYLLDRDLQSNGNSAFVILHRRGPSVYSPQFWGPKLERKNNIWHVKSDK